MVISLSSVVDASVGTKSVEVFGDNVEIKSVIDFTVEVIMSVTDGSAGASVDVLGSSVSFSSRGIIVVSGTVDVISLLAVVVVASTSSAGSVVIFTSPVVSSIASTVVTSSSDGFVGISVAVEVTSILPVVSLVSASVIGLSLVEGVVSPSAGNDVSS